jgi:hypothetical protein
VLAASAPEVRLESGKILGLRVGATAKDDPNPMSRADRVGASASRALETGDALTAAERAAALEDISRAPALMQPFLRRAVEDPGGLKRRILETMPRMLFVLLPIFAGILALFYRGRKYPEHLYFAIHLHAFIFLALAVSALLKFTQSALLVSGASLIASIWIPIYATLAFRRVYGGSLARTLLKEVAIAGIYALTAAGGFITMIYWVSVAT